MYSSDSISICPVKDVSIPPLDMSITVTYDDRQTHKKSNKIIVQANKELSNIRSSPFEQRILSGKEKMR